MPANVLEKVATMCSTAMPIIISRNAEHMLSEMLAIIISGMLVTIQISEMLVTIIVRSTCHYYFPK